MRRLPTRSTGGVRRRIVGALAVTVLGLGGLAAVPASAAAPTAAVASTRPTSAASPALDDGLALTPPMGFNNWNSTHCRADFNESMVKGIADLFVAKGLKDAGYQYVNLDDCWALPTRDANGKLVPDPVRFPNGIKGVADYVHSKGLKLGIYTSAGTKTCDSAGFPGGLGHEYSDAQQFADWGVDYLKYDNCNNQGVDAVQRYTTMRDALRATGRPIVYSICEWGQNKPWEWAAGIGQLWRTTGDISDSWGSMLSLMKKNLPLAPYAGPGHWNDPDMLEVGNGGMTDAEYRTHFSMWSVMASPLLIGTDLRKASQETYDILSNRDVIAVDQDPLGKQGSVVSSAGGRWVVSKEMKDGSRAVALFNESGSAQRIATTAKAVGLPSADAYVARDLWQHKNYNTAGTLAATVPAHGTLLLRVAADPKWAAYPPAAEVGLDGGAFVEPGVSTKVPGTFTNLGRNAALDVSVSLSGPEGKGWIVQPTGPTRASVVPGGTSLHTTWTVSAPAGTATGSYDLALRATYRSPQGTKVTSTVPVTASVATAPPSGTSSLGDLPWLSTANGYGPVERNTSNGEDAAGDGHPITIGAVVYAKGLGVHAPSSVDYYAARSCERVTAQVGVDDEKGTKGTVAFEVWADDRLVASTGTLTNSDAAKAVSADVTGAQIVRLVVTDGGDGVDSDHADWADAQLTC
ncbi:NPCBM/NEW2 domain-containing protein [Streptomyces sp. NPDC050085]|uniref:NPCBM/NEW2 domain-containing protein n=1 Tax=Streptomyces sp. NPDC050085 TaxID=3365600 RepID=UPI00379AB04B